MSPVLYFSFQVLSSLAFSKPEATQEEQSKKNNAERHDIWLELFRSEVVHNYSSAIDLLNCISSGIVSFRR